MVEETRDKRRLVVKEVECQDKLRTSSNYTLLASSHQSQLEKEREREREREREKLL